MPTTKFTLHDQGQTQLAPAHLDSCSERSLMENQLIPPRESRRKLDTISINEINSRDTAPSLIEVNFNVATEDSHVQVVKQLTTWQPVSIQQVSKLEPPPPTNLVADLDVDPSGNIDVLDKPPLMLNPVFHNETFFDPISHGKSVPAESASSKGIESNPPLHLPKRQSDHIKGVNIGIRVLSPTKGISKSCDHKRWRYYTDLQNLKFQKFQVVISCFTKVKMKRHSLKGKISKQIKRSHLTPSNFINYRPRSGGGFKVTS